MTKWQGMASNQGLAYVVESLRVNYSSELMLMALNKFIVALQDTAVGLALDAIVAAVAVFAVTVVTASRLVAESPAFVTLDIPAFGLPASGIFGTPRKSFRTNSGPGIFRTLV